MEFKLTRSQREIQKAARDFTKSEFDKELANEMDKKGEFPQEIHQKAAELGFTSVHFDEEYLGGGLEFLENTLMAEALCRKDSTLGSALMLSGFGADLLNDFGSKELKSKFLIRVAEGGMLASATIEAFSSSNRVKEIQLKASRDNDSWVINGQVNTMINADLSGFYCIICQTEPEESPQKSVSMILVEKEREGISIVNTGPKLGLRMTPMADLKFEDVQVPLGNIIGKTGDGLKQMISFNNQNSVLIAALSLGTAQGVLDRTLSYVKQRSQFGKKIAEFPATRHKLAQMALKIEQSRMITYQAAWQIGQKKQDKALPAMAKLTATQTALDCAHEAIQLHGGYGYSTEYEVERFCRDAKTLHLLGGSPGSLNDAIADTVIGKI